MADDKTTEAPSIDDEKAWDDFSEEMSEGLYTHEPDPKPEEPKEEPTEPEKEPEADVKESVEPATPEESTPSDESAESKTEPEPEVIPAVSEEESPQESQSQLMIESQNSLRKALDTYTNAANRMDNTPTKQNLKAAEKAQTRIDKLLSKNADEGLLDGDTQVIAEELQGLHEKIVPELDTVQSEMQTTQEMIRQQKMELENLKFEMQFSKKHPELAGDFNEMVDEMNKSIGQYPGIENSPQETVQFITQREWQKIVDGRLGNIKKDDVAKVTDEIPVIKSEPDKVPQATSVVKPKVNVKRTTDDGFPTDEKDWGAFLSDTVQSGHSGNSP